MVVSGGVSIGCVASLSLSGSDAVLIGMLAGALSTFGFSMLQGDIDQMGLHDSCGVHNLHGMPSILGGLFSVVFAYHKGPLGHDAPSVYWAADPSNQASRQLEGIFSTLAIAIVSGLFTGAILKAMRPDNTADFVDSEWWEVQEIPYPTDKLTKLAVRVDAIEANVAANGRRGGI